MVQRSPHILRAGYALLAAVVIMLISGSSASLAADSPARKGKAKPAGSRVVSVRKMTATPAPAAGMRVAIDPQTGQLIKPTLEQRHVLGTEASVGLDRSSEGLEIITLANGTKLVHLEGRFQEYVVARKDAAGNVRTDCVESLDRARRLQATPVPARAGLVRADESSRVKE